MNISVCIATYRRPEAWISSGSATTSRSLCSTSRDEDRTRVNGAPLADEHQSGADLSAAWRPDHRLEFYLRALRVDREFADGETSDLAAAAVGVA